jgi:DNA-binding transcriptional LysR family regulator
MKNDNIPMPNIELRQFRHLVALGRLLSFTKAAAELGITQSALTRSIQALEGRYQVRLVDRDRGRVCLTAVGKMYFDRAARLLQEADDLDRLLHRTAAAEIGKVRFCMAPAFAHVFLPDLLTSELNQGSQVRTEILIRSEQSLLALVQSEEVEFGLCVELPGIHPSLRTMTIGICPTSLLVRNGHPLLENQDCVKASDFPLIRPGNLWEKLIVPDFLYPFLVTSAHVVLDDIGILARIAAKTDAILVASSYSVPKEIICGVLRELPIPDDIDLSYRVAVYTHHRRTLSPAAMHIVDRMKIQLALLAANAPRSPAV